MPLYVLGFMGMTRRLSQQIDPQFHPMLVIAACGAALIACGILCQLIQFYVSIRDRDQNRDLTGDPWVAVRWSGQPLLHRRSTTSLSFLRFTNVMPSGK